MTRLLHVSASPRGTASESLRIADVFLETYRETHPDAEIEHWDLWDGTLPAFGPAAVAAKMAIFAGADPEGDAAAAWRDVLAAFARFDAADHLLFSVPMWNSGIPYVLKQFVDVVSQPGAIFTVDPVTGYEHLLAGRGKKVATVYTSVVYAPQLGPNFGSNFQSTYFADWLRWTGIDDIAEIHYHPSLTGDTELERKRADERARAIAETF